MTTKRRVLLDGNGSTKINVEGLGVYVPAIEHDHLKQKMFTEIQQLKDQHNAMQVDLEIAAKTAETLKTVTAERDQLAEKLAKLDELATRFIEDSEEIAEYFDAMGGRNHLVLAKDIREIADAMADALNEQTANGGEHDWDLINQKLDDARMVDKQLLDKKANCQLDCGAYGSYCKCNDEHSKISSGQDAKDGAK